MDKSMVNLTVLIDDSDIDLFIQRRFLEVYNFSHNLKTFRSAEDALYWLANLNGNIPPDVIFLDLNMPNVDGFEFLESFKNLPQKIREKTKIVVLTSSNSLKDREQVFTHANVIQFITKPIKQTDIEELRNLVTNS